jgi:uncharacterized protein (TIGR00288 family)
MSRPAAIFFDIENIVWGYGQGLAKRLARVSLSAIEGQIVEACTEPLGQFAVKRAYADWSKSDLSTLRKAIVEQGIEPRQVFGFGQDGKTNAADVELVIDVLELMHSRPDVVTFVIVSGDGGFGSLVRKLHEFGKQVIVAGNAGRSSGALRAVCDQFVLLDRLDDPEPVTHSPVAPASTAGVSVPYQLLRAAAGHPPTQPVRQPDELLETGAAIIEAITTDPACLAALNNEGLRLVDVANLFKLFVDTNAIKSTFHGLGPFLTQLLAGSEWTVAKGSAGQQARVVRTQRPVATTGAKVLTGTKISLLDTERVSIEQAAKGNLLELPRILGSVLAEVLARADGQDIEVSQFMLAANDTGLRETTQKFFGTITKLIRMSVAGTDLCVVQSINQPARHWVQSRLEFHGDVESVRALDDLPMLAAGEVARRILRQAQLALPDDRDDIDDVLRAISKMPLKEGETLNEFVARLVETETLPSAVQLGELKQMLAVLVRVEVLTGPSITAPDWLDRPARQAVEERPEMLQRIRQAVITVLSRYRLDGEDVLADLLPLGGLLTSEVSHKIG